MEQIKIDTAKRDLESRVQMADDNDNGSDLDLDIDDVDETVEEVTEAVAADTTVKGSRALQFLSTHHPECRVDYVEEVLNKLPLSTYPPDNKTDVNHKSVPYLTLFERTKIIGFRANQLAQGARPLIEVPPHIVDVLEIARLELDQKRLPFILKRPMPDGTYEYWRLADLLIL